jgi:hypothetical protein
MDERFDEAHSDCSAAHPATAETAPIGSWSRSSAG